ncbi:MAG: Hsp20/alpha crystallin family protein [Pseudobdellovibrionaceae bacterium]|uniref:Hsp20/alpha crystallin family protein n=1 Tax=Oligoflexus sp. TaxID=1971216 RepID=UPI0027BE79CB|nr:Hsp20/alpha crystallin family protein [Oligoflexus sp.]MDQ3232101.1 Hsp20/alpha crystallin family protein [Pseudobdellovibrionaceae bacterium]HYX38908.1 Hsp20/alpha crystallin family protein [Oligoflexus sp.]
MANTPDLWRDMDRSFSGLGSWRPLLRQLDDIFNETMDTRFDDGTRALVPQCDLEESEDHYLLSFDMPGMDKDNIDIEMQGNVLMVSGERKSERTSGEGRSRFIERRTGRFQRSIRMPQDVKAEGIEADYVNGVLKIAVPKSAESMRQKIKIGSSAGSGIFSRIANKLAGHDESHRVDVRSTDNAQQSDMRH